MQAISGDLRWSASRVNDAARRIVGAARDFSEQDAGRDYAAQGDRIVNALDGIGSRLFMWANCVNDAGVALGSAATMNGQVDDASAAGFGSIQGVVV